MRIVPLLLLFCVILVSGLYAQTPGQSQEFANVDFQADLISAGREITGVDFQADLISAGREITGVDFQADLISAGRAFTGVDFIATSTKERPDLAIVEIQAPSLINVGQPSKIQVIMKNETSAECRECTVFLRSEDRYNEKESVSFGPKSKETAVFSWTPSQEGRQTLTASLECPGDSNPKNNELSRKVAVMGKQGERVNDTGTNKLKTKTQKQSGKLIIDKE